MIKKCMHPHNFYLSAVTPTHVVSDFIKDFRPYTTNQALIRLGASGDGGYLVPDDLENIAACFSPGVDRVSEFEQDCLGKNMKIFMADASVDFPTINLEPEKFSFIKKHIGVLNNDRFITMDKWISDSKVDKDADLLLQMDIEGAEYAALTNISAENLKRFRIIVIEAHGLDHLWDTVAFEHISTPLYRILETHYCVHIHPNNVGGALTLNNITIPRLLEFTFLRKDRVTTKTLSKEFPHALDAQNTMAPPLDLPKRWYDS
ncbi:FkbM family methyltransferase [Dokdonia sinensis]|nr:FkbM family methyltransferase [Dokdonia sinensis]